MAVGFVVNMIATITLFYKPLKDKTGHQGLFLYYFTTRMPVDHRVVAAEVHRQDECHLVIWLVAINNRHNGFVVCRCSSSFMMLVSSS